VAQVTPVTFPSPGFYGLNYESGQTLLSPSWATTATNCVIDEAGRIAARKGYVNQTTSAMAGSPAIRALIEYIQNDGTTRLCAAADNKLWDSADNGATWTDRTGAVAPTANNWQFVNFNSKTFAAQVSHALIVKSGAGNYAAAVAATGVIPNNPVAVCAAFGRLWCIEADTFTIKYSALGDDTKWATADGAGTIDLRFLWTQGTDTGVAIAAFGSNLLVFGKRHIFIYVDGSGSDRGLDPARAYVTDTIEGVGCMARDSIAAIGEGDLMFLSQAGIRSMGRVIQEQATPLGDVSSNNRTHIVQLLLNANVDAKEIRAAYSPENKFYLITAEDANTTFCVDMRGNLEDGSHRITEWSLFKPTAICRRVSGDLLFGWNGKVGLYSGYLDDAATYHYSFHSGWMDLQEQNGVLKIGKRMKVIAYSPGGMTVTAKWFYDFKRELRFAQFDYTDDGEDEYGVGEYGIAEYSGGTSQRINYVPMDGSGQFILLGVEATINGHAFAIQSITAYYLPGRMA
jgi:hypothetical protein